MRTFDPMNVRSAIPNSFTLLNLLCGVLGVAAVLTGHASYVVWLMAISLLADFFDGMVARLLKADSLLGVQLDSFADMVSFGVLPAFLWLYRGQSEVISQDVLHYTAFLIPCFAALRLAKFNIKEHTSLSFQGLPTPAMALFSFGVFATSLYEGFEWPTWFYIAAPVLLSGLMVSSIPMFSFKLKPGKNSNRIIILAFLVFSLLSLVLFKFAGLVVSVTGYLLLNLVLYFIQPKKNATS